MQFTTYYNGYPMEVSIPDNTSVVAVNVTPSSETHSNAVLTMASEITPPFTVKMYSFTDGNNYRVVNVASYEDISCNCAMFTYNPFRYWCKHIWMVAEHFGFASPQQVYAESDGRPIYFSYGFTGSDFRPVFEGYYSLRELKEDYALSEVSANKIFGGADERVRIGTRGPIKLYAKSRLDCFGWYGDCVKVMRS